MGASKHQLFSAAQNEMAEIARVLAHPARIAILEVLAQRNACICGDIVDEIPLSQPTVSQHLKELKSIGLIKGTIEGASVCYCVDPGRLQEVKLLLDGFMSKLQVANQCC